MAADGTIRARLPAAIDPNRRTREFPPGHLAEATAWLDAQLQPTPAREVSAVTLGDWAALWHETYVEPIRPPNTTKWYLYALAKLASLYGTPLPDVRVSALQAIVGQLVRTLDAATVHGIVGVWRRCLDAAIEDDLISRNPARRLTVPTASRKPAQRSVTPAEVGKLLTAAIGHRFEAAYVLALGCGLRFGEISGLRWSDVDLPGQRAWISRQYTNGHWRDLPKASNPHWIPLPSVVVAALIRHRDQQPAGTVLVMQSPYGIRPEPTPWSLRIVNRDLRRLAASVGVEPLSSHAGRHGLASALIEAGVSPVVVAERLGHTDPGVTLRRYSHAGEQGRQQADEALDRYLGGAVSDDRGGYQGD